MIKRSSVLKVFTSLVSVVLMILCVLGMASCSIDSSIVKENANGDEVFALTFSEFVERYNENSDGQVTLNEYDFEKEGNDYVLYVPDVMYLSIKEDDTASHYITSIDFYVYNVDSEEIPAGSAYIFRALYPDMPKSEIRENLEFVKNSNALLSDEKIKINVDEDSEGQEWIFYPYLV